MKQILGLDLGTTSIGWALVREAENKDEQSSIVRIGVRVNPLTSDEQKNFEQGKSITTNADRTLKRSMRRNLQRYKLRRDHLKDCLQKNGIITDKAVLNENGNYTTFQTYYLRAKAVNEKISLEEFARVLLMLNKKRGYKSSRKMKSADEGQLIDGMSVAKRLYNDNITPGQYVLSLLEEGRKYIPDFYRSDLLDELDKIWTFQQCFYPEILTPECRKLIAGKGKQATAKIFLGKYKIYTADNKSKDKRLQAYQWRVEALSGQLPIEVVAFVVCEINGAIQASSGYLGAISDRSKELYFEGLTVGQYLVKQLEKNPDTSLKNKVFYRQDYLNEFEKIWEKQAEYHTELTPQLKKEVRDIIIFYQRTLKSQKGLVGFCEFESRQIEVMIDGKLKKKTVGCRVCPKSSPLFQEYKIWHNLNNLKIVEKELGKSRFLNQDEKETLFQELNIKEKLSKTDILKLLCLKAKEFDLNFEKVEGNRTQAELFRAYQAIIEMSGNGDYDFSKMTSSEIQDTVTGVFRGLGYNTDILSFDAEKEEKTFDKQPMYLLWHLLYSYEGDSSDTGNKALITKIKKLCGFESEEYARILTDVTFQSEYGNLSTKAIRRILPFMKKGSEYSEACRHAGYRHSERSLTKEELDKKVYKDHLELLPRNSLRNPVVEKILNQMIHVVNTVVDTYGKPDEIRIELARELKKSAKERDEMTASINKTAAEHKKYCEVLQKEFGFTHVSRNDIIRYKLYLELENNGYKTLYSDTYIPREKLFSKEFDIEHIIPQSKLFDDSFSNKTLECRSVNIEKSNDTAYDYVLNKYGEQGILDYKNRIENLYKDSKISRTKYQKLMMKNSDISGNFIERELRDSQYIAKKAREILEELVKFVVPTTGSVTARLREDWQLVDVMQELNWKKYDKLGLTDVRYDKDGREIRYIKDWSKRNDHRHHAMDALTIAFTKRSIIQYLNNLNAKSDKSGSIYAIEQKELFRDKRGKLKFIPPMPCNIFRAEAKRHLENVLVSVKAKNKVVTPNINRSKGKNGINKKIQLTPRGQLHNETIYGSMKRYETKWEKIGSGFDERQIAKVANKKFREALLSRLAEFGNDPQKAFTGKNSLEKNPLYVDELHNQKVPEKVKIVTLENLYTIRKEITPDLKIDKVVDAGVRRVLQERLDEFDDDSKKAFSNLDENPIWLNGKKMKRVTIMGVSNAVPLHDKKDYKGNLVFDSKGRKQPVDFVNTGSNHHVAIYRDESGELQDIVVSFYEATTRSTLGIPVIDKEYKKAEGWNFLFSMKQNEYFVFPNEETGFNPKEIDLMNPDNYTTISPNLYRVQKFSKCMYGNSSVREYVFRHHLETSVNDSKGLKNIAYKNVKSLVYLEGIVKVRINHIGQIVSVGEY